MPKVSVVGRSFVDLDGDYEEDLGLVAVDKIYNFARSTQGVSVELFPLLCASLGVAIGLNLLHHRR
jgi:hypothetical protein